MALKTSLGMWALGPMITRFVPVGYQAQRTSESIVDKVKRAVAELGDLIDAYEFHYPHEINEDNAEAIKAALGGDGIMPTSLHLCPAPPTQVQLSRYGGSYRSYAAYPRVAIQVVIWPSSVDHRIP